MVIQSLAFVALCCQTNLGSPATTDFAPTPPAIRQSSWLQHERMRHDSPLSELNWEPMGPVFQGGRIESIATHPEKPSVIYAGVGSGGLWKSVNAGTTWEPIFEQQAAIAVGDCAVSTSEPNTVWLGTGEVLLARSSLPGAGVFKSTDAGESWSPMGLVDTQHIARVVIHPKDPNTVFVAAIGHQNSNNDQRGVFRTSDGGETWKKVLYINDHTSAIDLAMHPESPHILYASMWERADYQAGEAIGEHAGLASGVYRTDDAGDNWQRLDGGLPRGENVGRIAIALAPSQPSTLYALADEGAVDGFYCSTDSGRSWAKRNEQLQARWDWCELQVSPDNPEQVYSIGQNSFVTDDGGDTFRKIEGDIVHLLPHGSDVIHLDTHAMWINPSDANHLMFGTDGGIFVTHDRCQTWLHYNNMPIAECYAVTYDMDQPPNAYVGTQDNAALFGPVTFRPQIGKPDLWRHVYLDPWGGGDSYFTYRDPSDENTIFYEHQMGDLRRKNMQSGVTTNIQPAIDGQRLRFAWMTPFFPSVHAKESWYFAANRVFKSNDRGDTWTVISEDLVSDDRVPNLRYRAITALAESPLKPGVLFAGSDNADLHVTLSDGATWSPIGEGLPQRVFTRIVPSFHDASRVYATQSGAGLDDFRPYISRSDDLGKTWFDISSGLPHEPINVVIEDPKVPGLIYVGTDMGIYAGLPRSDDTSADSKKMAWISLCANLPTAAVHDMFVHPRDNVLVIATHGRSCYVVDAATVQDAARAFENLQKR